MTAQIIEKNGHKEFAVVAYKDFLRMQQRLQDYEDLKALCDAKANARNRRRRPIVEYMCKREAV
jgi:hypothetical protein